MAGIAPVGGVGTQFLDKSTLKEDVSDIIYQITPTDTPMFHLCGDVPANVIHPFHQFQVRSIPTYEDNAQLEGRSFTFTSGQVFPSRAFNVLQILDKDIRISRTNQQIGHYGIPDMMADQTEVRLTGLKTDMEVALIRGTFQTGNTAVSRRMIGIIQAVKLSTSTYTNATGITQSESLFNGMLENSWAAGADIKDVLVDGRTKRWISQTFTGGGSRIIDAQAGRYVNTISEYESDYGTLSIHLSRALTVGGSSGSTSITGAHIIVGLDKTHLKKAWLQAPFVERTAKVADSEDAIAQTEFTLEFGNPSAHFVIDNAALTTGF